jgi:hypothetical protein
VRVTVALPASAARFTGADGIGRKSPGPQPPINASDTADIKPRHAFSLERSLIISDTPEQEIV